VARDATLRYAWDIQRPDRARRPLRRARGRCRDRPCPMFTLLEGCATSPSSRQRAAIWTPRLEAFDATCLQEALIASVAPGCLDQPEDVLVPDRTFDLAGWV